MVSPLESAINFFKEFGLFSVFVIGMLVVATNQIVTAINKALPNVVLLAISIICFLMLVGVFYKTGELDFAGKHSAWTKYLIIVIFIILVLIFANSIQKVLQQLKQLH